MKEDMKLEQALDNLLGQHKDPEFSLDFNQSVLNKLEFGSEKKQSSISLWETFLKPCQIIALGIIIFMVSPSVDSQSNTQYASSTESIFSSSYELGLDQSDYTSQFLGVKLEKGK